MIQITPHMRILVAVRPIDFRKGIDGIVSICRDEILADAFSGTVFVFRNRKGTSIKVLVYDGQGYWLCQKRLSVGRFQFWPESTGATTRNLDAHELQLLLWNGNYMQATCAPAWRKLTTNFTRGPCVRGNSIVHSSSQWNSPSDTGDSSQLPNR